MRESAVSAKRGWGWFGAKPAQSETPARAAAEAAHARKNDGEDKHRRSLPCQGEDFVCREGVLRYLDPFVVFGCNGGVARCGRYYSDVQERGHPF